MENQRYIKIWMYDDMKLFFFSYQDAKRKVEMSTVMHLTHGQNKNSNKFATC